MKYSALMIIGLFSLQTFAYDSLSRYQQAQNKIETAMKQSCQVASLQQKNASLRQLRSENEVLALTDEIGIALNLANPENRIYNSWAYRKWRQQPRIERIKDHINNQLDQNREIFANDYQLILKTLEVIHHHQDQVSSMKTLKLLVTLDEYMKNLKLYAQVSGQPCSN